VLRVVHTLICRSVGISKNSLHMLDDTMMRKNVLAVVDYQFTVVKEKLGVGGWVWLSFVVLGLHLQCRCNHYLHNFVRLYKLSIIVFCDMFIKNETILILNNSSKTHLSSSQFMGVLNMALRMYQVGQIILYILHAGLGLLTGKRASCFVIWPSYVMQCLFIPFRQTPK
jgi:hypothetical protein